MASCSFPVASEAGTTKAAFGTNPRLDDRSY